MKTKISVLYRSLAAAVLLCSATTHAAESQSYTINLAANIPADTFYVIPVDSGWIDQTQTLGYDMVASQLQVFEKQFQYKNTAGAIQATLTGNLNADGQPHLSNGEDTIPLAVTFNSVALSKTATTVVTADAANSGGRTALKISQADQKPLTVNGSFTGAVAMIFEPVVPASGPEA